MREFAKWICVNLEYMEIIDNATKIIGYECEGAVEQGISGYLGVKSIVLKHIQ